MDHARRQLGGLEKNRDLFAAVIFATIVSMCVYSWAASDSPDKVEALVLLRVDDFLLNGSPRGFDQFRVSLPSCKTGPLECASQTYISTFRENPACCPFPEVVVSQDPFICRLSEGPRDSRAYQGRIIRPRLSVLKVFRRPLGAFDWLVETQYYASYLATRLGTSLTRN